MGVSSGQIVYEVYGSAMFQLAQETGRVERIQEELAVVSSAARAAGFCKINHVGFSPSV
jgi:F0F1-type ATP synthase delta subunit